MKEINKNFEIFLQLNFEFSDDKSSNKKNNVFSIDFLKQNQKNNEEKQKLEIIKNLRTQASKLNW